MTKTQLLGLAFTGLATIVSCDSASPPTAHELAANDCPIGTFRPPGITDCVVPASDQFNNPIGVSDNRCASGQAAIPPTCVTDSGERAYLATSTDCAPGYRYLPGACNRNNGLAGFGGLTGTAGASTGFGGLGGFSTGAAGSGGFSGCFAGAGGQFGECISRGGCGGGCGGGFGGLPASTGAGGVNTDCVPVQDAGDTGPGDAADDLSDGGATGGSGGI